MRRCALTVSLLGTMLSVSIVDARHAAQTGTPAASPPMVQVRLDELPPDRDVVVGIIRTTYSPGGELSLVAGAGPTVVVVESGSLVVASEGPGPAPCVVRPDGSDPNRSDEIQIVAGDALILSTQSSVTIRNGASATATTLTLLRSDDAQTPMGSGTTEAILVRLVTSPPPPPLTLTLSRATIEPGERFSLPPSPIVTVLAVVERSQAFSLSGDEINRGKQPIDIYALTLSPSTAHVEPATPPMAGGAIPSGQQC